MRWFSVLAILFLVVHSLELCCSADWAKIPHEHIVMGTVTPEGFAHHHDPPPQMVAELPASHATVIHDGIILSVSSCEWLTFLAEFNFLVFPYAPLFLIPFPLLARVAANDSMPHQLALLDIDPPPRSTNS
jgi:hypothetical protein